MKNIEKWVFIENTNNKYMISSNGNIKSFALYKKGMILYNSSNHEGYTKVGVRFCNTKRAKNCLVHRLVAQAFITNPENKPCVNHKNGIRHDNKLANLEWCTYKENSLYSFEKNLNVKNRVTPVTQYTENRVFIKKFNSIAEAAKQTGSRAKSISKCVNKERKKTNRFIWERTK